MISKESLDLATRINASNAGAGLIGISTIPGAGLGLFATRHYNEGEWICAYNGEAIFQCLYERSKSDGKYALEISPEFVVDAKDESSIRSPYDTGRYINGTKNPVLANCEYYLTKYGKMFPIAYVRCIRPVKPGQEFLCDYGPSYHYIDYKEPANASVNRKKKYATRQPTRFF